MAPKLSKQQILVLLATVSLAQALTPLYKKKYKYSDIPYKVDTDQGLARGEQLGYNQCNASTEGPSSLCQTAILNSLDDFCLWAPPVTGKTVGEIEGEMVAWCTKGGHGTRVMPAGTITGVQFTRTPDYIQVVGFMDQTKVDMVGGDSGGEMDPHGADQRGNPIGGLVYTTGWTGGYTQASEWHNFNGDNTFCFKICDPSGPMPARYCEHVYDLMGCGFNAPSNAQNGVFESCAGDSQDPPGQYTDASGAVQTWKQGDGTVPYEIKVPKTSSCSQFRSADIFEVGVSVAVPAKGAVATVTSSGASSLSSGLSGKASGSVSSTTQSSTQTSVMGNVTTAAVASNSQSTNDSNDSETTSPSQTSPSSTSGSTRRTVDGCPLMLMGLVFAFISFL